MLTKQFIGAVALTLALSVTAHASLIGDTITADLTSPTGHSINPGSAVVNGGIIFNVFDVDPNFSISVSAETFSFVSTGSDGTLFGSGNILDFGDLDWIGQSGTIVGVSLLNKVDMTFLSASNLSFTADTLTVDLGGVGFFSGNGDSSFDVVLDVQHGAAVPEPSSLALLGLAAAGMVSARKRRVRA